MDQLGPGAVRARSVEVGIQLSAVGIVHMNMGIRTQPLVCGCPLSSKDQPSAAVVGAAAFALRAGGQAGQPSVVDTLTGAVGI
jgi:hypothetical protein